MIVFNLYRIYVESPLNLPYKSCTYLRSVCTYVCIYVYLCTRTHTYIFPAVSPRNSTSRDPLI